MKTQDIENQLTPAAKIALNELIDDYRQQLLLNAARTAAQVTGDFDEISVRDIVAGAERYSAEAKSDKLMYKKKRIMYMSAIVGFIYMIGGLSYYLYTSVQISRPQLLGLTTALVGAVLSLVSYFMARTARDRSDDYLYQIRSIGKLPNFEVENAELQLIKQWTAFELLSRDLLASLLGESRATESLGQILNFLVERNIWDKKDYNDARMLLDMRNSILHKGTSYERSQVAQALDALDRLTRKITTRTDQKNR